MISMYRRWCTNFFSARQLFNHFRWLEARQTQILPYPQKFEKSFLQSVDEICIRRYLASKGPNDHSSRSTSLVLRSRENELRCRCNDFIGVACGWLTWPIYICYSPINCYLPRSGASWRLLRTTPMPWPKIQSGRPNSWQSFWPMMSP